MAEKNKSVLCFNNENENLSFSLSKDGLKAVEIKTINETADTSIAIFNDRDAISYSFDIEKGMLKEELDDAVEMRMFQDAGLNHMIDYKIAYSYRDSLLDAKSITVNAIAIVVNEFTSKMAKFRDKVTYIDAVIPFSTLPLALYSAEILEKKSDVFLYIREKDATVSLFFEGNFIYAKNINAGFASLYEAFIRNDNETVSYEEFEKALTQKGLNENNYTLDDKIHYLDLRTLFETKLNEINNILNYTRRIAGIQSFNRIFIGTEFGTIPAILPLLKSLTSVHAEDYVFYTDFYLEGERYIDQNVILAMLECQNIKAGREANPFNLTIFPRPPKFLKRESGKFIAKVASLIVLTAVYPLYLFVDSSMMAYSQNNLIKKLNISKAEFLEIKAQEEEHRAQKKEHETLLESEQNNLTSKLILIEEIQAQKDDKNSKVINLNKIFHLVNKNNISIEKIEFYGDTYTIDLRSLKDEYFTAFLISLSEYEEFDAEMNQYVYDEKIKRYRTTVTVKVKS